MGSSSKPRGAGSGNFSSGSTNTWKPGQNFWEFNPRNIAGNNQLQRQAAQGAAGLWGSGGGQRAQAQSYLNQLGGGGSGYMSDAINSAGRYANGGRPTEFKSADEYLKQLRGVAGEQVTGANLATDPAILAAQKQFTKMRLPMIQNMASQMGLGRSNTVGNASALAQSNELLPLMQEGLAREERGLGRRMSGLSESAANAMQQGGAAIQNQNALTGAYAGAAGQEASNLGNAASGFMNAGSQEQQALMNAINANMGIGGTFREQDQQRLDAPYDEQQRLWAEALNSMYGPLGFLGNMGGARSSSSKK